MPKPKKRLYPAGIPPDDIPVIEAILLEDAQAEEAGAIVQNDDPGLPEPSYTYLPLDAPPEMTRPARLYEYYYGDPVFSAAAIIFPATLLAALIAAALATTRADQALMQLAAAGLAGCLVELLAWDAVLFRRNRHQFGEYGYLESLFGRKEN